jgi:hypothetical protein
MSSEEILKLLATERDKLSAAIAALSGGAKRRGRPPKSATIASVATATAPKPARKRRVFTAAQRKAQGERMKAMWAKRRAAAKNAGK